jgi:hypothetical protein
MLLDNVKFDNISDFISTVSSLIQRFTEIIKNLVNSFDKVLDFTNNQDVKPLI